MRVAFNQDSSCCVAGTPQGFRVYNCSPFGRFYASDENDTGVKGVSTAEMLYSTSLVAVAGNGDNDSPRRLTVVNTQRQGPSAVICELTFPTTIRALRMNRTRLAVVLDAQIYIYDIANMKLLHTLDTVTNGLGVVDVTTGTSGMNGRTLTKSRIRENSAQPDIDESAGYSAQIPGDQSSGTKIVGDQSVGSQSLGNHSLGDLEHETKSSHGSNWLVYPSGPPPKHHVAPKEGTKSPPGDVAVFDMDSLTTASVIRAHRSPLAAMVLNQDGTLLATSSDRGTLVRVFAIPSGTLLYEFRRGSYQSKVYSLSFNLGSKLLCVSSATQTVHIYKLDAKSRVKVRGKHEEEDADVTVNTLDSIDDDEGTPDPEGKKSRWFRSSSSRDFAWFKLPLKHNVRTELGIAPLSNTVYVASESGKLFHYAVDEKGGECHLRGEYAIGQ